MTTIANIEAAAESFFKKLTLTADSELAKAVNQFLGHAKDEQADADAISRLVAKGYLVTPPGVPGSAA